MDESPSRGPSGSRGDAEGPAHPTRTAALLMIGVLVFIVAMAALGAR